MKYRDMNDKQLLEEIHRVQDLILATKNRFTKNQNRKYLEKLHLEWTRRKYERLEAYQKQMRLN